MRTVLFLLLLALPLAIQADSATQVRQLEKALARLQQESQSIQQQFMMIQELRRNEMSQPSMTVPLPSTPGQSIPIPNYDNLMQSKQEREQRIEKYTADLNRLYARYTELENEKQTILEQINSLEQKTKE
ncbi:MAG: hypothetical protein HRU77_09880 [Gammaproteobacteria bacterium]|jgi:hypothetical protein|nr:hypothetical protein [Pseudomonadota bacterium]QOJ20972.1 MAG: hypothetical protein HRU77_09880 [Gammaproteobacteria bacterium]